MSLKLTDQSALDSPCRPKRDLPSIAGAFKTGLVCPMLQSAPVDPTPGQRGYALREFSPTQSAPPSLSHDARLGKVASPAQRAALQLRAKRVCWKRLLGRFWREPVLTIASGRWPRSA